MGFRKLLLGTGAAFVLLAGAAVAKDVAFIVATQSYRNFADVENAEVVMDTAEDFRTAGFQVVSAQDATVAGLQNAVAELETALLDADRVVVVLSGAFLHSSTVTWYAPMDLRSPSLSAVGFEGLSVQAILGYLGQKPGGAALFLASDGTIGPDFLVTKGIGRLDAPQGVLIVQGKPQAIRDVISKQFLLAGRSLADAVRLSEGEIAVQGYVSDLTSLLPTDGVSSGPSEAEMGILEEAAYWKAVIDLGTIGGFNAYLQHYPDGEFAESANARILAIEDATPKYTPQEQVEIDLNLTRNDRSRVQEQLSFLGFNTRGIDGLFGPATRAALTRWQSQNERQASGFLTAQDMQRLRAQAEKRAKRLALEAQAKQEAHEAADAAFWQSTGANGTEPDLLAYLRKYPDGLYSVSAKAGLREIETLKREQTLAEENAKWDVASTENTKQSYLDYLEAFPNGTFAEVARARVTEIEDSQNRQVAVVAAKAEEEKLPLNAGVRLLLEQQLSKLALKPGTVDGVFDQQTRKSLRAYQKSRGLEVSGYLTRATIVQLMAE